MTDSQAVGTMDRPEPADWGPARQRLVVWHDPLRTADAAAGLTGLEFLQAIADGSIPRPPIASLLGLRMVELEVGRAVFECEPDESVYNPIGVVHGGLACTLADTVIGCAVQTTLGAGVAYTSIDLSVSYLRPVTVEGGVLRATGTVTKPGRRVAFAVAEIVDGSGKPVATATGSCLVMEGPAT